MAKNIVVFSDGTGQEGGLREEQRLSNVYKLYRIFPAWPARHFGWLGWPVKVRGIAEDALVHPSVRERFAIAEVTQCAGRGRYRPAALTGHEDFKAGYAPATPGPASPATA